VQDKVKVECGIVMASIEARECL